MSGPASQGAGSRPARRWQGSFLPLLLTIVALLLVEPLFEVWSESRVVFELLMAAIVLAALVPVLDDPRWSRFGIVLAIPAITLFPLSLLRPESFVLAVVSRLFMLAYATFITSVVLRTILRPGRVNENTIVGAICSYLLIGLVFAMVFALVELIQPGSYVDRGVPLSEDSTPLPNLLYYAFVTMTTLGYGEILPTTGLTRSLAALTAVIGQLYVAILIAALVSRLIADNPQKRGE